jgi:hypothetical protein
MDGPASIHQGTPYRDFLKLLHRAIRPKLYFEIGVGSGGSLSQASCASIAIDPKILAAKEAIGNKPQCHFYQMSSDEFFAQPRLRRIFPAQIDFAFLDGLHHFEVLLRDFINTERFCALDAAIVLHDCVPYNCEVAERHHQPEKRMDKRYQSHWAGDVWKIIEILRRHRPDLCMTVFDCPPTGLVVCTNLNPESDVLRRRYQGIVHDFMRMDLDKFGFDRFIAGCDLRRASVMEPGELKRILFRKGSQRPDPVSAPRLIRHDGADEGRTDLGRVPKPKQKGGAPIQAE